MIVNAVDIVLQPDDLQRILNQADGKIDNVKDFTVTLENGVALFGGRISLGLTIPFKTKWKIRVADDGYSLCLNLAGVSVGMIGMGEELVSSQILSMLSGKFAGHDSVRVVDKDILVDLRRTLAARGVTLNSPVRSVEITPAGIALKAGPS